MYGESAVFSRASSHDLPPSADTCTLETPRSPAKAIPAMTIERAILAASAGTSIRVVILGSWSGDQPRTSQYP